MHAMQILTEKYKSVRFRIGVFCVCVCGVLVFFASEEELVLRYDWLTFGGRRTELASETVGDTERLSDNLILISLPPFGGFPVPPPLPPLLRARIGCQLAPSRRGVRLAQKDGVELIVCENRFLRPFLSPTSNDPGERQRCQCVDSLASNRAHSFTSERAVSDKW